MRALRKEVLAFEARNSDPKKSTGRILKIPVRLLRVVVPPNQLKEVVKGGCFRYIERDTPYLEALIKESK